MAALERDDRNQEIIVRVVFFFFPSTKLKVCESFMASAGIWWSAFYLVTDAGRSEAGDE